MPYKSKQPSHQGSKYSSSTNNQSPRGRVEFHFTVPCSSPERKNLNWKQGLWKTPIRFYFSSFFFLCMLLCWPLFPREKYSGRAIEGLFESQQYINDQVLKKKSSCRNQSKKRLFCLMTQFTHFKLGQFPNLSKRYDGCWEIKRHLNKGSQEWISQKTDWPNFLFWPTQPALPTEIHTYTDTTYTPTPPLAAATIAN